MASTAMGKIAQQWEARKENSHSLTAVRTRLAMKIQSRIRRPPEQRVNRIDCLIGDAGIGKSTIVRLLADDLARLSGQEWHAKLWHVGSTAFEDNVGLPIINEHEADGHAQKTAGNAQAEHVPGAVWQDYNTLGILDELPSANPQVQDQLRAMIDGVVGGAPIDPRCILVGTGNPPDASYVTVNALDLALEKRLKIYVVVPTTSELLQVWSVLMPETIYKFLLMNQSFIDTISPREWVGVAQDVQDVRDGGGSLRDAIEEAVDELFQHKEVVATLHKFIKFGDDKDYYPILGRDIIGAMNGQMKEHLERVNRWFKREQRGLVGETVADLMRAVVTTPEAELAKDKAHKASNVAQLIEILAINDCADMVKTVMETTFKTPLSAELSANVASNKALPKLREVALQLRAMQQRLHATASP